MRDYALLWAFGAVFMVLTVAFRRWTRTQKDKAPRA
jgi:hypothetical protein